MNKSPIIMSAAALALALTLTACEGTTEDDCEATGITQDITTMQMGERPSGGSRGGSGGSRSGGSRSGSGKVKGSSSGGSSGGKVKVDDDWFEECDD